MATLLQQLENILQSWDGAAVAVTDDPAPPCPDDAHNIPFTLLSSTEAHDDAEAGHDTRRALSRVELARAALALFASNAGPYRPVLQKVLRFLFRYLDSLIDERARWRLSTGSETNGAERESGADETGNEAANDEVARAYQKIRLVEMKMQLLVEEASAQRDRFRAQIAAHEQQETKLTMLLQHQMELTDALLLHPATARAAELTRGAASGTGVAPDLCERRLEGWSGVNGGVRDAAHVRRLITRAAKEKALEELELEVRRVTQEGESQQRKITDLLKLNSRYARQAVELAARLSIIHEHNIALATDAQLFQRDAMQEQQRADKLARELATARGMLLTAMETRSRELLLLAAKHGSLTGLRPDQKNVAVVLAARDDVATAPREAAVVVEDVPAAVTTLDAATAVVESMVLSVQDNILRHQLQHVLAMQDPESAGAVKAALMALLNLNGGLPLGSFADATTTTLPSRAKLQLYELRGHGWSRPRGEAADVPRHLRSIHCVPLHHFHPVVAECFVYELLSQRRRFCEYSRVEDELNRSMVGVVMAGPGQLSRGAVVPGVMRAFVPLDEFVELFVGVVWLNRGERLVRLLPEKARRQLTEYVEVRQRPTRLSQPRGQSFASSHANSLTPSVVAPPVESAPRAEMQLSFNVHLQRLLHSMQLPEEMLRLNEEGLKLTYGLDVLSRSPQAGFLTYAFGSVSRGEVSEVVFDVMRSERAVLLAMCAALERGRRRGVRRPTEPAPSDDTATREEKLQGCIPLVQLARVLMTMFPSYPLARLEQLCIAAAEDATDGTENPVMVYYTVLLPLQQLPGAAHASAAAATAPETTSFRRSGAFASLFYKSICDDALESLQMIEDSIESFMEGRRVMLRGGTDAAARAAAVTMEQLTTLALQEIGPQELQYWGPALRATMLRWALRFYGTAAGSEGLEKDATDALVSAVAQESDAAARRLPEELEACLTSARIVVRDVMPYLRQHLVPRRGPHALPLSSLVPAETRSDVGRRVSESAVSSLLFPSVPGDDGVVGSTLTARHAQEQRRQRALKAAEVRVRRWSAEQSAYLALLQARWAQYAPANEVMTTELEEFMALLHEHDRRRGEVWATVECGENNHFLRTVDRDVDGREVQVCVDAVDPPRRHARRKGSVTASRTPSSARDSRTTSAAHPPSRQGRRASTRGTRPAHMTPSTPPV